MKRSIALVTLALLTAPPVVAAETGLGRLPAVSPEQLAEAQSTVIFTFADSVPRNELRALSERAARAGNGRIKHLYAASIKGFSAHMNFQAAQRLVAQFPEIVSVERDQIATTLGNIGAATTTQTDPTAPWGTIRVHGKTCGLPYSRVWILDTGIELTNPDLSIADAALHFTAYSSANDKNGHGTHVAGTVAARDKGTLAKGVAPRTPLVPVKVLNDRGSGAYSDVIAGIDWVAQHKKAACEPLASEWCGRPEAWVVNMSLGGPKSDALNSAVLSAAEAGIRFALAAGNESTNAGSKSPASANHRNIFTVAASTSLDGWAWFSNYGSPVDYVAPGVSISSTYLGGTYRSADGTSMASPHVAGILTIAPGLLSSEGDPPLSVGSVPYTDGTITGQDGSAYDMASFAGGEPQTVSSESECQYVQTLMKPPPLVTSGSKGGPKR